MAGFTGEMAQKIYRGLASHRANLAGALQWDNPEAQAMQRFLEADPRGKKNTLVMPSPFSVKAKLANCCSKFAGVSVTAPASARGGGVTAHALLHRVNHHVSSQNATVMASRDRTIV